MPHRFILVAAILLSATAPSLAQATLPHPGHQGTADDQRACEPAVHRYCKHAIPDTFRVLHCLQTNRARIGKACQAVLASYGQ